MCGLSIRLLSVISTMIALASCQYLTPQEEAQLESAVVDIAEDLLSSEAEHLKK